MKRIIWTDLLKWKNSKNRKPLILRGARQVGKTYILREFGKKCFSDYHYINCENIKDIEYIFAGDLIPKQIIKEISLRLDKKIDIDNDLIFFDEIQYIPRALTALKYFAEDLPQAAVCSAGSLLGIHLANTAFPVGKVDFLDLYPLSFFEFIEALGDVHLLEHLKEVNFKEKISVVAHKRLWEYLKYYFVVGGLPEVVNVFLDKKEDLYEAFGEVREKQFNLIESYNSDMAKHSGKENAMHIQRVWENVPAQIAKENQGVSKRFKFKNILPNKKRYSQLENVIDWLLSAGLLIKVKIIENANIPFATYSSDNIFKLYIFDVGILGALGGIPIQAIMKYDYGSYKGFFAENFVGQEFVFAGCKKLYSWKGRKSEVEFVREINGQIVPVEVKAGSIKHAKSLGFFSNKYKQKYKVILSAEQVDINTKDKVYKLPLYFASMVDKYIIVD